MTFFNHLLPVGVSYITVRCIPTENLKKIEKRKENFFLLGRLKLRFQGHVTEWLGATSTNTSQEKVAEAALIYLRPQVGTDGEIWQHFVGLRTAF